VDDAQRLTNSGTFLHAAPWNGSLGEANLSHGCINASNEDAQWMMDFTLIGDPVEIVGSDEQVSPTNGWGDWNIPAAEWAQPIG
jgi:lipoprotein-anchoring transpeptidase ErfK/SrfK